MSTIPNQLGEEDKQLMGHHHKPHNKCTEELIHSHHSHSHSHIMS
jgi:hypothetical protein